MKSGKRFLSIPEFVSTYPWSRSRTYELLNSGDLKAIKIGTRTHVDSESADALLECMPAYKAGDVA